MNIFSHLRGQRIDGSGRKAVYTCIFGDYDDLKSPTVITPGWDYICFTDDPTLRSDVWDVRLSPRARADRQLEHKRYATKHLILFHRYLKGYELSLYASAEIELNCNLDDLMREYFRAGDDMMICNHDERDCVYDEAEVCKAWLLDDHACIDAQMQRYRATGYPAHNGLYAGGIIARRHDRPNVRAMCKLWWDEYRRGSRRNQLSLNYAIWKSAPIKISAISFAQQFEVKRNFKIYPHKLQLPLDTHIKPQNGDTQPLNSPGTDYIGYINTADSYAIRGWAADRNRLNTPISVSLYEGDTLIATVPANLPRSDVGAYLGDNGLHGFAIPAPARLKKDAAHSLSLRFETGDVSVVA